MNETDIKKVFIMEDYADPILDMSLKAKVERSEKALKLAADMSKTYYGCPLVICYSGGKDSDVLLHLAESCLNPSDFEVLNSHTTVDAPETVYHIRDTLKRINQKGVKSTIDYHEDENGHRTTMWNLIPKKLIPPTRIIRYCCAVLKESGTPNKLAALGVRGAESSKRQGRNVFGVRGGSYSRATFFSLNHAEEVHRESQEMNDSVWDCTLIKSMKEKGSCVVNPIYEWTDSDIWDYIRSEHIITNPLYECGYSRVGCIGCPFATHHHRIKEFQDYPKYKGMYISAFDRMLLERDAKGKINKWKSGEEVFDWWLEEDKYNVKGQITMDEWLDANNK